MMNDEAVLSFSLEDFGEIKCDQHHLTEKDSNNSPIVVPCSRTNYCHSFSKPVDSAPESYLEAFVVI